MSAPRPKTIARPRPLVVRISLRRPRIVIRPAEREAWRLIGAFGWRLR